MLHHIMVLSSWTDLQERRTMRPHAQPQKNTTLIQVEKCMSICMTQGKKFKGTLEGSLHRKVGIAV